MFAAILYFSQLKIAEVVVDVRTFSARKLQGIYSQGKKRLV